MTRRLLKGGNPVILTKISQPLAKAVLHTFPGARHHPEAKLVLFQAPGARIQGPRRSHRARNGVSLVSAGTADIPVAEEAALTAELLGTPVRRFYDVGVAGIHRVLRFRREIAGSSCVIVVAGMEGALASVVGGLAPCPVIAVPTSVGYGTGLGGVAALLSMLNSCAANVSVVNIDDGFGAGVIANLIDHGTRKS